MVWNNNTHSQNSEHMFEERIDIHECHTRQIQILVTF
jgi:hypothetical protein